MLQRHIYIYFKSDKFCFHGKQDGCVEVIYLVFAYEHFDIGVTS